MLNARLATCIYCQAENKIISNLVHCAWRELLSMACEGKG